MRKPIKIVKPKAAHVSRANRATGKFVPAPKSLTSKLRTPALKMEDTMPKAYIDPKTGARKRFSKQYKG